MFTFQVTRLTSVVVYMKWFRSKCKRQAHAGGSVWPGCLRSWVLPAPAQVQAARCGTSGFALVGSFLSLTPLQAAGPSSCRWGTGWVGKRPSPFIPLLWVSSSMGLARGCQRPKPLDCLFLIPWVFVQSPRTQALARGPEEAEPASPLGASPLGLCPNHLLLPYNEAGPQG